MASPSDQPKGKHIPGSGRNRKSPGDGLRNPPRHDAKSKHVGGADPGRLQDCKPLKDGLKSVTRPLKNGQKGAANPFKDGQKGSAKSSTSTEGGKGKQKAEGKGDIDDIFAGVKRIKEEKAEEEAERVVKKKKMKEEHKRRQANPFTGEGGPERRWAWADEVKPVRFDDEGLPIYTWDSLRIGQGGGTELCPFDCDCCF